MSGTSQIEWTERTWNPTTGCSKVSAGCKNCYAEAMAIRLKHMKVRGYENGFALSLMPERLQEPLQRRKASTYFVNSMSDLFHEKIPFFLFGQSFFCDGKDTSTPLPSINQKTQKNAVLYKKKKCS